MGEGTFRQSFGEVHAIAAAVYASGEVVQLADGRAAIVGGLNAIAIGDPVVFNVIGSFELAKASATVIANGAPVYWDASVNQAVGSQALGADFYCGVAVKAAANGDTVVLVDINVPESSAAARAAWRSASVLLDHADATEHEIIPAAENGNGLIVDLFTGLVVEAPAGSSEDQLVLQLLDEDDNVLSVLTTTDTTPDAAGDLVQGTLTAGTGATGVVLAVIPAGKAAKVKVSQATAGTPAGSVRVSALVSPLL